MYQISVCSDKKSGKQQRFKYLDFSLAHPVLQCYLSNTQTCMPCGFRFKDLPEGWQLCSEDTMSGRHKTDERTRRRKRSDQHDAKQQLAVKRASRGVLRRAWDCVRTSWPVQLCLALLVLLGLSQLCTLDNGPINNWRNAWGPQLNYVRGPPPS